jgi:RNA polymerase sigma-70 factor (sigma-B/F/G subfamily)
VVKQSATSSMREEVSAVTHVRAGLDEHRDHHQHTQRDRLALDLFRRAADAGDTERRQLLDEVVLLHLGLAEAIARRYYGRSLENDDILQVAHLGLVNAAQRFDPELGRDFVSFAVPTIAGEIKRHFRDHGWAVRPPRRMQELQSALKAATAEVTQAKGATPTAADLADHLGVEAAEVREARASHECFTAASLDYRVDDGETSLADTLGGDDAAYERSEALVALAPACRELGERDRRILYLRFFRGWTQEEIGRDLGVTQMQVSRLLAGILRRLRARIGTLEPA